MAEKQNEPRKVTPKEARDAIVKRAGGELPPQAKAAVSRTVEERQS